MMTMRNYFWTLILASLVSISASAELRLTKGAVDFQVYQRDAANAATLSLAGEAPGADGKRVEARILVTNPVREERGWQTIATVANGKWQCEVPSLSVGGPYSLELRIAGTEPVVRTVGLLVGDLWVLAGQSNMEGVADLVDVEPPHSLVGSFDMTDTWGIAQEPLHFLPYAVDRVHWSSDRNSGQPKRLAADRVEEVIRRRTKGAGLGLPFAVEMVRLTGVPVGLIPVAHGGTSMDQWDPAKRGLGGDSLYGSMLRRVNAAGGKVKGVLWYQGESDASEKAAPLYHEKFKNFIAAVRQDFNAPDLPFYYAQIGLHIYDRDQDPWDVVQESERQIELEVPRVGMVATIDAELDDGIHVGTASQKLTGKRLANLACHDLFPDVQACRGIERGPRPLKATRISPRIIRLECGSVNGALKSAGKMWGFTVVAPGSSSQAQVFKATVDPANPHALLIHFQGVAADAKLALYYSKGRYSYANIVDEANMALPAFGPMEVE
ncbi:MAG: sialate O-acetylesterase [Bryobacterales bacterium]|nr:sialate O-acetylesterase [Bryobacterales bacterium]